MLRKILLILALLLFPLVYAQLPALTKSVAPRQVLEGEVITVSISIEIENLTHVQLIDSIGEEFDFLEFEKAADCDHAVEYPSRRTRISCDLWAVGESRVIYNVRAREGGVFTLPGAILILEDGKRVESPKSTVTVTLRELDLPTTTPPPPETPISTPGGRLQRASILLKSFWTRVYAAVGALPGYVVFFGSGIILFIVILFLVMLPFFVLLGRGEKRRERKE